MFVFRTILKESGYPRYLHSAVLLGGTLLIFGGNTHNDTSLSNGAKCFSADFLAYDIGTDGLCPSLLFNYCLKTQFRQAVCVFLPISSIHRNGFLPNLMVKLFFG